MPLNIGALLGGNRGEGGLGPALQDNQQRQQQQQMMAAIYQAMQQGLIPTSGTQTPPGGVAPPSGLPQQGAPPMPGMPSPSGPPPPQMIGGKPQAPANMDQLLSQYGGGSPSTGPQQMPQQSMNMPQVGGAPQPQGAGGASSGGLPSMTQFMAGLSKSSMPDWAKGAAAMKGVEMMAPMWAAQQEQQYRSFQEWYQTQNLGAEKERLGLEGKRVDIQQEGEIRQEKRDATKTEEDARRQDRDDKKVAEKERYDRMKEQIDYNKNLTAEQKNEAHEKLLNDHYVRMDDINAGRADTYARGTGAKIVQGEEKIGIDKDKEADRERGTNARIVQGEEKITNAKENTAIRKGLSEARIKEMAAKVAPENKKQFTLAIDEYNRKSQQYLSLTRPGQAFDQASPEDRGKAKADMDAAQEKAEKLAAGSSGGGVDLTVDVVAPDGTPGTIPASNLDTALKQGFKKR